MDIKELKNKTVSKIDVLDDKEGLSFYVDGYKKVTLQHTQDCCECVELNDVCGDLDDLLHSPLLRAEVETNKGHCGEVVLRFLGESNGYYSEDVDVIEECVLESLEKYRVRASKQAIEVVNLRKQRDKIIAEVNKLFPLCNQTADILNGLSAK